MTLSLAVTFVGRPARKVNFVTMKKIHLIGTDEDKTLCGYSVSPQRPRQERTPVTFTDKGQTNYRWNDNVCRRCLSYTL
jgi:hypothetical protein